MQFRGMNQEIFLLNIIELLIREFKNYEWKEDQAGKATNEPIDKFNHGISFAELSA